MIPTTYNSETNTITFATTSFSNYAIASKNATLENYEKDNSIQKEISNANPKTGDNVIVYFVLFVIAILLIVTLVIINNKKSKKERKY